MKTRATLVQLLEQVKWHTCRSQVTSNDEQNAWEKTEKSASQAKPAWCKHEILSLWCKHMVLSLQLGRAKRILEPSKQGVLFLSHEMPSNAAGAKWQQTYYSLLPKRYAVNNVESECEKTVILPIITHKQLTTLYVSSPHKGHDPPSLGAHTHQPIDHAHQEGNQDTTTHQSTKDN